MQSFIDSTSPLVGGEWLVSRFGWCTPRESLRYPRNRRLFVPQICSGRGRGNEKYPCSSHKEEFDTLLLKFKSATSVI